MPTYRLRAAAPAVSETAYISPSAIVIGDVVLAAYSSIWFGAVVRGDNERIFIGENSNIQDLAAIHSDPGHPMSVGQNVSVGHQAMLHGCTIGDNCLVGIQAVVLNGAVIGKECLIAAGAVVTERKRFEDGSLILGSPARTIRPLTPQELEAIRQNASSYKQRALLYRQELAVCHP